MLKTLPGIEKAAGAEKEFYLSTLRKYLEVPYIWTPPETETMLKFGDPNYDLYMCRNTVLAPIVLALSSMLIDNQLLLSEKQNIAIQKAIDSMPNVTGRKRTQAEMDDIKAALTKVIESL